MGEICLCFTPEHQGGHGGGPDASLFLKVKALFPVLHHVRLSYHWPRHFLATMSPEDMLGRAELRILAFSYFLLAGLFPSLPSWSAFPRYAWKTRAGRMLSFQNFSADCLEGRRIGGAPPRAWPPALRALGSAHPAWSSPSRAKGCGTLTLQAQGSEVPLQRMPRKEGRGKAPVGDQCRRALVRDLCRRLCVFSNWFYFC